MVGWNCKSVVWKGKPSQWNQRWCAEFGVWNTNESIRNDNIWVEDESGSTRLDRNLGMNPSLGVLIIAVK